LHAVQRRRRIGRRLLREDGLRGEQKYQAENFGSHQGLNLLRRVFRPRRLYVVSVAY
jgi:hypothetical protein